MKKNFYWIGMLAFLLFSCQETLMVEEIEEVGISKEKQTSSLKSLPVPSTYFDWENLTSYQNLSLPWNTFTNSFIPNSWRHNHKRADGWELLYNTLDRPETNVGKFFALYNKYLGIMRIFFIKTEVVGVGQKYALAAAINGTSILFNNESEDFSLTPMTNATVIKTQPLTLDNIAASQGFIYNAWYGTEFHFEYENVSNRSDIFLQLVPYKSEIKDIALQSETTGGITGTIQTNAASSGSSSLIGSLAINFAGKKGKANTDSKEGVKKIADDITQSKSKPGFFAGLWQKIQDKTPGAAQNKIVDVVNSVVGMGINWASNPIMNFAKSALGIGSSATPTVYDVKLKVKTNTVTSGTITSTGTLGNFALALPTTSYSSGGYGYPTNEMEDFGLGVWTLNQMPIVELHRNHVIYTKNHQQLAYPTKSIFSFEIKNRNSISIVYNPKVLQDCEVLEENITYSFGHDKSATNSGFIEQYGIPFKYDRKEYYELQWSEMYGYDRLVQSEFLAENVLNIEVHVGISFKHKQTGKIFNHIKTIKLPIEYIYETNYQDIDGEGGIDFPMPPDEQ